MFSCVLPPGRALSFVSNIGPLPTSLLLSVGGPPRGARMPEWSNSAAPSFAPPFVAQWPHAPLAPCARVDLSHQLPSTQCLVQHGAPPRCACAAAAALLTGPGPAQQPPLPTYTRCVAPKTPRDHGLIDGDGDFAGHGDGGHDASTACLRGRPPHRPTRNPREQTNLEARLGGSGSESGCARRSAHVWFRGARRHSSQFVDAVAGRATRTFCLERAHAALGTPDEERVVVLSAHIRIRILGLGVVDCGGPGTLLSEQPQPD